MDRARAGAVTAGAVGGALAGVGLAVVAGFGASVGADVGFVVGAVAGGVVAGRAGSSVVVVVGVAAFLLRLLWVRPALLVGVGLAALVAFGASRALAKTVNSRSHVAVAACCAVVVGVVAGAFGVHRHLRFGSGSWDHGCYLHNAWLFGHGQAFSTTAVSSVLGDAAFWGGTNHFMPSLVFTAPLDWLMEATSSTSLLLWAQAIVVAAAAVPLAALARHRGLPLLTTTALVLCFLLAMGTQAALLFDVHEIAPVPLLLFFALWIVETKAPTKCNVVVVGVVVAVLGGCKESALLYAAAFGTLCLLFRPGWRAFGAVVVFVFVAAFCAVVFVVQPALLEEGSAGMIHLARFSRGDGGLAAQLLLHPGQTLAALISPDVKLTTLGVSGAGFGFLPFVSGEALVLALPNLAERFLADKREMWGLGFHYGLVGAAFLAWGALVTLQRLQARLGGAHFDVFASVFLLGSLCASFAGSPSPPELASYDKPYYASDDDVARYRRALAVIGADEAVVAQNHFLPHLALREHIWLPEPRFIDKADVVVLDAAASPWPHDQKHVRRLIERLQRDPRFTVAFHEATTWVFRRARSST
jgi:uncharacterized membrane protein